MQKQIDPNFVPCFFLRSSFILSSYKKKENRKVVRKKEKKKQRKTSLIKNWHLIHTVILVII